MSTKALLSVLLGSLSFCLSVITGIPAVWLGFLGLREINESDGRLRGRFVAVAGMALGATGSILSILGFASLIMLHLQANAQRLGCGYNLARIGQSINQYCDLNREFPSGTIPNVALSVEQRLSWLVSILPFIEPPQGKGPAATWYDAIDRGQTWDGAANTKAIATRVLVYRCPADKIRHVPGKPGLTNYVGVAGVGGDAATLPKSDPRAGFFGYDRKIFRADITRGISDTMSAIETTHEVGAWAAAGFPTVRAFDPAQQPYFGYGRPFGGLHPGGTNVLFVDTSVRFMSDNMQPSTLERLATIHGEQQE